MMSSLGYAAPMSGQGWNSWQRQSFIMPQGMVPDPNFLVAHRQAMMYAKQAYQMAVAQQAMAVAGDEWERSSSVSGMSGMNMFGAAQNPYAMGLPVQGMGMMGGLQGGWARGAMMMPQMYGFGSTQSDIGHVRSGGNASAWDRMSVYGESFGPSGIPGDRTSMAYGGPGPGQVRRQREDSFFGAQPPQMQGGSQAPSTHSRPSGSGAGGAARQRQRTTSVPTPSNTNTGVPNGRRQPPTSWRPINA
jgi:serine/arginine repetitive matrix protein 2